MKKISAVYKIVNTVTGEFYIGSSRDVKHRWACHKIPSTWKIHPNSLLYKDFQKYGVDKFRFQILAPVMPERLKQVEQDFIDTLKPAYNSMNAKGRNKESLKESHRRYNQSDKGRETRSKCSRKYKQSDKGKEYMRKYNRKYSQSEKGKEYRRKYNQSERGKERYRKYYNQLCSYKGETLTLSALSTRFRRAGAEHPNIEAKKYLIDN